MHNPTTRPPRTDRPLLAALAAGFLAAAVAPAWGQVINEDLKLLANDGAGGERFGGSVAIDSGVIAVGAWTDDDNGTDSGSAYLFDASTGTQIAKLLPSDGAVGDKFGWPLAIDNGIVAVGALFDDDNGADSGSVYLFDVSTGAQIAKLLPSDGAGGDQFGGSIAIDNGIVVVGAPFDGDNGANSGSVYVFDASTGAQIAKLLPNDGSVGDQFGNSIAIANGIVAVGAYGDAENGTNSGSAYVFDASTGAQIGKLLPDDGAEGDEFGFAIAIHNGVVAVGALLDSDNGFFSGSAYVFDASTGAQIAKLLPSDGAAFDFFGCSIAIESGVISVGARFDDDNGTDSGSAYLFDASTGAQIAKLLPSDGAANDTFGWSISIDSGVIAVGANHDADNGTDSGSAYVFDVNAPCRADLNGDGAVNTLDFLAFLNAWTAGEPIADWDGNGTINTLDFLAYLNDWVAGC